MTRLHFFSIAAGVLLLGVTACVSAPKAELDQARLAVKRASQVNANKYAPETYGEAREDLKAAESNYEKDNKTSKKHAIQARIKAEKAYFQSNNRQTQNVVKEASRKQDTAKQGYAHELVPKKYKAAVSEMKQARADLEKAQQKYKAYVAKEKQQRGDKK